MTAVVERLIKEVKNSQHRPELLSIAEAEVGELADHFFALRRMRGSDLYKEDIEQAIRDGLVSVIGIPVRVAA